MLEHRPNIQCQVSGIVLTAAQLGEGSYRKDSSATEPFRAREEGNFPPFSTGNFPSSSTLSAVHPWSWVHMKFLTSTTWTFWRVLQRPWKIIFPFSVTGHGLGRQNSHLAYFSACILPPQLYRSPCMNSMNSGIKKIREWRITRNTITDKLLTVIKFVILK